MAPSTTQPAPARSQYRNLLILSGFAAALWLTVIGCTSGLGKLNLNSGANPVASENVNQGFDLGGSTRRSIDDLAVAGAQIPLETSAGTQELIFVAFTSDITPADFSGISGSGSFALSGATDANGTNDVFVAVASKAVIGGQPSAFNQGLIDTFHDQRCIKCHGFRSPTQPTFSSFGSTGNNAHLGGPDSNCADCHNGSTTGLDANGNVVVWEAPDGLDFREADGTPKTAQEIVTMLEDFEAEPGQTLTAAEHLKTDDKIFWAIENGTVPQDGRVASGGAVPITFETWMAQVDAWEAGGRQVTTADAIMDVSYGSLNSSAQPSGGSSQPALTYLPNGGFDPANPTATFAGTLLVAFVTDASSMTGGATPGVQNVYITSLRVNIDATGNATLTPLGTSSLASAPDGTTTGGGNADSARPSIAPDGSVTFESLATNLIPGFVDGNGASGADVYHRAGTTNRLLSRTAASFTTSGDDTSGRPKISRDGSFVAFESRASDLVASDGNDAQDVFLASISGSTTVERISERADGSDATGGESGRPAIFTDGSDVLVAFQSSATNLSNDPRFPGTNVFLYDSTATDTPVTVISRRRGPSDNGAANGSSFAPSFSANGTSVYFETLASNLDGVRTGDANQASDIVRADITGLPSRIDLERVSITGAGRDGNGDSVDVHAARFERFDGADSNEFAIFRTTADNLGTPLSTDLVIGLVDPNSNPSPSISTLPERPVGLIGELFTFDARNSTDPDEGDSIVTYDWDFGDGTTASGDVVTKSFGSVQTFTVTLETTDTRGGVARTTFNLRINASNSAPTCDTGNYPPTTALATVNFDASGSTDPNTGDDIVSYEWDFGDGNTATGETADHEYLAEGSYTVTLTVEDYFGASSSCTTTVDVIAVDPNDITFTAVYNDILMARCSACHDTGDPYFDVSFANPSTAYTTPGNIFDTGTSACYTAVPYIVAGDPDASLFIIKTDPNLLSDIGCAPSGLMPSPSNPLTPAQYLRLRLWIENGALNN